MIERYKSIKYAFNTRTKRYTIYVDNALLIKDSVKAILGKSSTNLLILKEKANQFDIYEFFLLELEYALETMKESRPDLAINIGGIAMGDLLDFLKTKTWLSGRITKNIVNVLDYNPIKAKMKYNLLPHQVESFNKYETIKRMAGIRGFMLDLAAGQGKMHRNGTLVKTPTGWKKIEKLKVNDDVIGSNGRPTKVTGVYPQGKLPLVRLRFEDNRSNDVGMNHLWAVYKNDSRKSIVLKTSEIIKLMDKGTKISIPTIDYRVNKDDKVDDLVLHPYLLGVLLNDSYIGSCINISTDNKSAIEKIRNIIPDTYKIHKDINTAITRSNYRLLYTGKGSCPLISELKRLKLIDKHNIVSSIPNIYMDGSYLTRLELMKGLLDTGYVNIEESINLRFHDVKLSNDIQKLSWSLGDICHLRKVKVPYALEKTLDYYELKIQTRNPYIEDIKNSNGKLELVSYRDIPEYEATCISVSANNHLYVVKDHLVTHNTYTSLALGEALYYNNIIIIAPSATIDDVWVSSVTKELYKAPQPFYVLNGKNKDYKKERFLIFSYETLDKINKDKKLLRLLKRLKPMLIVDEFHNFNNITALRTYNLMEFIKKIDFTDVALLTGTPVKMSLNELKPMLYVLDDKFPPVEDRFDDFYRGKYDMFRNRFDIYRKHVAKDTKNLPKIDIREFKVSVPNSDRFTLETINREITEYKIERLAEILEKMDVYESMFETLLENVYVSMVGQGVSKGSTNSSLKDYKRVIKAIRKFNKDKKLYMAQNLIIEAREMEKEFILPNLSSKDKKTFRDIISIIKYPELKVLGEALGKILLGTRIKCYNELAANLNYRNLLSLTDKKAIVFSNYVSTCKIAAMTSAKEGFKPVNVYGDHIPNLPVNVKKFNDLKDKANPIVATYKSLSTGVPLLAGNIVLLLDIPVRNYLLDQSISRAWRIGQDRPVMVFMIKLDTGNVFNITDRDHFILNLSTQNVEMITGNANPFEIPEQLHHSDVEDDFEEETDEALIDLEEDIKSDMEAPLRNLIHGDIGDEDSSGLIANLINKFKFKL